MKPLHTLTIAAIAFVVAFVSSSFIPQVTVFVQWLIFGTVFLLGIVIWRGVNKP